jgi:hypothetical protein
MKGLQILSTGEYKDGYFNFSAQCTDGNFYDVAISKDEVEQHIRHYFDTEFSIKDSEVFVSDYADFCQIIIESWERSDNKGDFMVYVTAQKKTCLFFKKDDGSIWQSPSTFFMPTKRGLKTFMKKHGFVSFKQYL